MAAAKKASTSTALSKYDEELARQAQAAAEVEANTGGGQWIGTRGGILKYQDEALPNNELICVIADFRLENVYYDGEFDPDTPQAPACFAFGVKETDMAPHESAEDKQAAACADCPMNEWGSADKGRGKACRNVRRLAVLPVGLRNKKTGEIELADADDLARAPIAFLKVPVTSTTGYGTYVKQLSSTMRVPPFGVATLVKLTPDPKKQVAMSFECIERLDDDLIEVALRRHKEASAVIEFPYAKPDADAAPRGKAAKGAAKKPAVKAPPARGSAKRKY